MHNLAKIIAERVSSGLKRKSLTSCSRWASACRVMGKPFIGPWSFKYHPWLREMHDSTAEMNVGKKSAQMGFTETVLNITFYKIDIERVDCLYVLPAKTPDASDFSAARFDPALELSLHLSTLFSDVKNIGHKRAGSTNLYIRGSKSRAGLKSVPVGFLVLDELDEMDEDNIPLALERQSGQMEKSAWAISTPTLEDYGISVLFEESTQEHFLFKCPACSRLTELKFPECLHITAESLNDPRIKDTYLRCKECQARLEHRLKYEWLKDGKWIPDYTNRDVRGFYINQLYSSAVTPLDLAKSYLKSLYNPADEQEFFNSKLGLAHTVSGSKITDENLISCIGEHRIGNRNNNRLVTMGVDVGKWLHCTIDEWILPSYNSSDISVDAIPKTICIAKYQNFEDLDHLMAEYQINYCVIDANPERRKAFEFACRFWGYVKMCFYARGQQGKQITIPKDSNGEPTINVDRTTWLDLSLSRFRHKKIVLPIDTPEEYKRHLKALVRIYEKDPTGNPIGRYVKGNQEDHYAHSRNYSEIALLFATGLNVSEDILESPV